MGRGRGPGGQGGGASQPGARTPHLGVDGLEGAAGKQGGAGGLAGSQPATRPRGPGQQGPRRAGRRQPAQRQVRQGGQQDGQRRAADLRRQRAARMFRRSPGRGVRQVRQGGAIGVRPCDPLVHRSFTSGSTRRRVAARARGRGAASRPASSPTSASSLSTRRRRWSEHWPTGLSSWREATGCTYYLLLLQFI